MIEKLTPAAVPGVTQTPLDNAPAQKPRRALSYVENERTAGSMPSWHPPRSAKQTVESALSQTSQKTSNTSPHALAYNGNIEEEYIPTSPDEEFGFADLVDMVNPLQHIPVVSHIYREITGDEIKPIGQIIGGAVFGGPAGAASGLVNVVIEEETGKDIVGNALSFAKDEPKTQEHIFEIGPLPETLPEKEPITTIDVEELRTIDSAKAQNIAPAERVYDDLPASLLAFTDAGAPKAKNASTPSSLSEAAHGRTAGYIRRYS